MRAPRVITKSDEAKPVSMDPGLVGDRKSRNAGSPAMVKGVGVGTVKLKRILVPVDFTRESAKAMRYAVTLSRQFDASITLVHVVEPDYGPGTLPVQSRRRSSEPRRMREAKQKLALMGQRILGPCRMVETVIRTGLAFYEITEGAKALGADLIILGTHGPGCATRSLMGATAERVVRHAPCPVLVVRPNEHEFIE